LGDLWGNLARGVATVSLAPAAATGLLDRGEIRLGARADVIRVSRIGQAASVRGTWVQGHRVA
jgi:alpha-D-ribose 1-methylphosphonate 5-triphosphate diphosphatase